MRKLNLILLVLLLLSPIPLLAQKSYAIDKSSIIIGGSAGFSNTGGGGDDRFTQITARPDLSFFVVPNLAIGGNAMYSRFSASGFSSTFLGIGPKVAYYFGDLKSKSYPFLSSSFFYGKQLDFSSHISLQFSGGIAFMVAKNVAITGQAFFLLINEIRDGPDESGNRFGIEIGISTFVF